MSDNTYFFEYSTIRPYFESFKSYQKAFLEVAKINIGQPKIDHNSAQLAIHKFIQKVGEATNSNKLDKAELDVILEVLSNHQANVMNILKELTNYQPAYSTLTAYNFSLSNGINALYGIRFILEDNKRTQKLRAIDSTIQKLTENARKTEELDNSLYEKYPTLEALITEEINKSKTKYSEFATYIDQTTTNVQTLFSLASTEAIGKIFNKRSEEESKVANDFRLWSIIIMIIIFALDLLFIYRGVLFGFTGLEAFSAVTLSLILLTPAIYLSKESTKHRKFEQENIKVSQSIAAINSLIGPLKPDDKNIILKSIAESLLNNMQPTQLEDSSPNIHIAFGEKILEKLRGSGN